MAAPVDPSNGYEAVVNEFISLRTRSRVGAGTVRGWAETLPKGAAVLDLGCGHGVPVSEVLFDAGLTVYAVDSSPSMVAEFRRRFPDALVECAPVEESQFFGRQFDAIVAWGLMFLLSADAQAALIHKIARALRPGGKLVFTAPQQVSEWPDSLTGRRSASLGSEAYRRIAQAAGLLVAKGVEDEGENHYYFLDKPRVGREPIQGRLALVACAVLIASVACEAAGPADYSPAAVVEGYVRDGQGRPVPGLSIEVSLLKGSCTEDPVSTISDPNPVVSDVDGYFSGRFETLAAGPISVACMIIRAVDEQGGLAAEILVEEQSDWMSPPQDTVVVELTT